MNLDDIVAQVLMQSPPEVTEEHIRSIIADIADESKVSVPNILATVWKIPEKQVKANTDWDERRQIMADLEQYKKSLKATERLQ